MKKLMVMCVAVAIAAVAQAASVSWSISNVYSPTDSTAKIAAGGMSAWLFVTANTTDVTTPVTTLATVQEALASGNLSTLSTLAAAHASNTADGIVGGATGLTGFSSGSLTAIALIVDSTDLATAQNAYLVSDGAVRTATFTSATGIKSLAWGDQTSYTKGGSWTAVPEPTSGLLMLLGMAGLALRRRRA